MRQIPLPNNSDPHRHVLGHYASARTPNKILHEAPPPERFQDESRRIADAFDSGGVVEAGFPGAVITDTGTLSNTGGGNYVGDFDTDSDINEDG